MKVGFTGTREGMTHPQGVMVQALLEVLDVTEFHHGDCVGADADADHIACTIDQTPTIVVHPPKDDRLRAWCSHGHFRDPLPYLDRNRAIVDETDVLIATPKEVDEQLHGGTWYTVRYAIGQGRVAIVVPPDGIPVLRHTQGAEIPR